MSEKTNTEKTAELKDKVFTTKIQSDLAEYRKQREQLNANIQAVSGAIQALERLLKEGNNG